MAQSIKVAVQASLTNTKEIIEQIREALETGLASLDNKSLGFLDNIAKKLSQATELFDQGSLNQARKMAQEINNSMYSIYRALRVEAGAASDEVDKLNAKVEELKKQKAIYEVTQDPELRYRRRKDGTVVYSKSGLTNEQIQKIGGSTETGVFKDGTVTIPYGGKNSSMYGIANAIASRLREEEQKTKDKDTDLINELKEALKSIGFEKTDTGVKFINLSEEYNKAVKEFQEQLEQLTAALAKAQKEFDEENNNVAHVKVAADGKSFDINPLQQQTSQNVKNLDEALEEQNRIQKEATKATKQKSDADEEAAIRQIDLKNAVKEETAAQYKQTGAVTKAVTTFFGYQMVIRQLRKLWREAIRTITELDKQLTNQAIVTNLTREETWKLVSTYQDLADQAGVTQTEIAKVTTEYLRQGETLDNALTLTKAATAAATVAGISASDSVKYLTTAVHGFKLEAEDALAVSDKFAALAAQAATNYEDLAIALSKVASQAELAGMSMDYTLALLTTGLDVTQEAPESIGTALKTVIARMREISDYGKTLEDNTDLNQVEAGLKAVGIALRNGVGELRSTEDVLDDLGKKWKDLSANQQAAVAKALAGTRQQSRLVAIMENYDDVLKNMAVAQNSLGATTAQQVKYLQGMEAAMNRLQNAYQTLIEGVIKSDLVVNIVNILTGLIKQVQKFLSNPAGRTALVLGVISFLTNSKQLMDKIRATIGQILQTMQGLNKEQHIATQEQEKQLSIYKAQLAAAAGITEEELKAAGIGKAERPNGWISNRPDHANFASALGSILNPVKWGQGWKERVTNTWKGWYDNNSLHAKLAEHRQEKENNRVTVEENIKTLTERAKESDTSFEARQEANAKELAEAEAKLAAARDKTKAATEAAQAADAELNEMRLGDDDDSDAFAEAVASNARLDAAKAEEAAAQNRFTIAKAEQEALKKGYMSQEEAEKRLKVLRSKQIKDAQKVTYLAKQAELAEVEKKISAKEGEISEAKKEGKAADGLQNELLVLKARRDGLLAETKGVEQRATGEQVGGKFSTGVAAVTGIASAAAGLFSMLQGMVETIQNRYAEISANAIDKATEIQSKIYNNTQTMNNLQSLGESLRELDRQVIKSANTVKELNDTRQQLIKELELNEADSKLYNNQQLYDKAMAKRVQLEAKNNELLEQLGDTLLGAANNYDPAAGALNILTKIGTGAGLGAMATSWAVAGGASAVVTAVGTAVGAIVGGIVGTIEEISKGIAAADAKGKVHEMLQSDEGVSQMQYYFKAMYKNNIDTTTAAGQELANNVKTTYASLIDSLSGEDMEKLLNQYNWNTQNLADSVSNALAESGESLRQLTSDTANYQQRVAAANEIYLKLNEQSEEMGKAFMQQYSSYIELGLLLQDSVKYMDEYKWSLMDMNDLLSILAEEGWAPDQMSKAVAKLGEAMRDGTLTNDELTDALGRMSIAAQEAAVNLINGGMTMQELADQFTLANNTVATIRDTQAKWNDMNASDRQRFIDENEDFFNIEGAREAFYNGGDITSYIETYKKELQDGLIDTVKSQMMATEAELFALEQKLAQATSDDQKKLLANQIATIKRNLEDLKNTYSDVNSMFNLTLSEVVKKQDDQIAKLKEMYQAEEKALTDSLTKRKEAYQKYFSDLQSQEAAADYALSRDQLIDSISRLSAGTDATSRNKVAELRKQLAQIEKDEAKRKTEEARQAVLNNIDNQVKNIQENFEQLLNNNKELLARMNDSTKLQYLQYLATLGITNEDYQQRVGALSDLLDGTWTTSGRQNFNDVKVDAVQTPQSPTTQQDPQSVMNLTIGNQTEQVTLTQAKMKDLIQQMFTWLNANAGTHFKV